MEGSRERPIAVTHVIAGLELGGAEMMLYKLLSSIDRARFDPTVISLSTLGPLAERIAGLGIGVSALGMPRGRVGARSLGRLARGLRARGPRVVHTWMYHADLLGGALARATGEARVIWGVRGSLDRRLSKRSSLLTARACALSSRWLPDRIVSCSQRLAELHVELGYDASRMTVIPNGFDLSWFKPEPPLRALTRERMGVARDELLVGTIGRFDPQKDHRTFLSAAGALARSRPDVSFVMCGPGVDAANVQLGGWIEEAGVADRCRLLGAVQDTRGVLNALDVLVCSSAFGEGFPNVLGEGMACGLPCVTTDVGDAAMIVADTSRVVSPGDPPALARAIAADLSQPRAARAAQAVAARARIADRFELGTVARTFEDLYTEVLAERRHVR